MTSLSVIILTFNEELNLPACLESLKGLAADLFVVDSGSTDRTVEIARAAGAAVYTHHFENYSSQRNWSIANLPIDSGWELHLDADERLTPALVDEINRALSSDPPVDGFLFRKRTIFLGKWIRHGGHYPSLHLRLFRREKGRCEDKLYDQHFLVDGTTAVMKHDYMDIVASDLDRWILRHVRWAKLEAQELARVDNSADRIKPKLLGSFRERRRFLRDSIYARFPLFLRPVLYFHYRYFLRLGFLDGRQGFLFHFLQAYWYRVMVDVHLDEARARARSGS